jgi:hypothetical protein
VALSCSAKKEDKARQHVAELVAGTHKSQRGADEASKRGGRDRPQSQQTEPAPKRRGTNQWGCKGKPEKEKAKEVLSSPQKRARTCKDRKEALEPDADGLIPWSEVKPVLDLQQQCIEHFQDKLDVALGKVEWLLTERDSLRVLLARSFQEGQSEAADSQHREMVKMLVGEGWDPDTDKRQFERARAQVLAYVKSICGKDTLKQQQLCLVMGLSRD